MIDEYNVPMDDPAGGNGTSPVLTGQAWHDRVAEVALLARAKLPQCDSRIDRALALILADAVTVLPDGTTQVASQHHGTTTAYVVRDTCECPDVAQAPDGLCKHRLASLIYKRARQQPLPGEGVAPSSPPPPAVAPVPARSTRTSGDPTSVVDEAIAEAERVCQTALESTPAVYRGFLTFLPRRKKVGGTKERPLYADIREPYLQVNGRLQMAIDEHMQRGATLQITTAFVEEPLSGQLLCRAQISALRGIATAHARVVLDARSGVDSTNPCENAETSAVGRALGFLGYGLLGGGIASAEDVAQARDLRESMAADTRGAANGHAPHGPTANGRR